jgi:hypothetical protein
LLAGHHRNGRKIFSFIFSGAFVLIASFLFRPAFHFKSSRGKNPWQGCAPGFSFQSGLGEAQHHCGNCASVAIEFIALPHPSRTK